MSKAEQKQWRRTSPLAAIFYLGSIFEAIAKNAVQSLAPLIVIVAASKGNIGTRVGLGLVAFSVIVLVASIVRYLFFRYRITDDSVLIREGVFNKTQLDIKFERIQAINTQQNVIYRYFDLVTVKFDTAGSAGQEGNLPAVRSELAQSLKERIRVDRPAASTGEVAAASSIGPILSLGKKDMLRIGLSSNRALILLVLLGPLMDQLDERVDQLIESGAFNFITGGADTTLATGAMLVVAGIVGVVLFMMIASIVGAFLRYHEFSLVADEDVLRSTGGLLTRHEHSINLAKIQSFEATQNPVLRLFNRFRLRAKQASSDKPGRSKHFVIPLCTAEQLPELGKEVFRDEFPTVEVLPESEVFQPISTRYFRSRFILTGILPALLITAPLLVIVGPVALVFLLWVPVAAACAWIMYKKRGYFVSEHGLILRRGFLGFRTDAFLHRKVQRISVTQTVMQERKGLATVRFFLASGTLNLPYVDHGFAKQLRDYVLYRVESSQLAWH